MVASRGIDPARSRRAGARAPLALAAAVLGLAAAAQGAAPAAGAPLAPSVVVSPLPGTPDANPRTQISFLGAPASRLRGVLVKGSRSGVHAGRLAFYSTHTGGSFLPTRPFDPGERVTVTATVVGYGRPRRIGTSFTVSTPYTLTLPRRNEPLPLTATNVMRFHSRPDLRPAAATVTTPAAAPQLGDVFVTPDAGPGQAGPMILSPGGQLVWFEPLPWGTKAFDLNVQRYRGRRVLTWWQGHVVEEHGQGVDVIDSDRYERIATVRAGNGLYADLHDFRITPQGTAWITAYAPQRRDLRPLGGLRDGLMDDGVVQEIDVETGLVMFAWHALGHVALGDTHMRVPHHPGTVFDYFHINSLEPVPDGRLLISSRNTWGVYMVSERTGAVLWRLGGRHSTFKLAPGVHFAWQHDAELRADGTLSMFDDEDYPPEAPQSSALEVALRPDAGTATLVRRFTCPGKRILTESQGDVQQLPGGDELIGFGHIGEVCEVSPGGALTFDMHLAAPTNSYRAFRYPWSARPPSRPALAAAAPAGGRTQLYASWNGATDVAAWRVLAGADPHALAAVGTYSSTGFETAVSAPTTAPLLRVQALSAAGRPLASSPLVKR